MEAADLEGRTALHWACKVRRPELLELILQHSFRAVVNRQDENGLTALHWAVMIDHADHVALLLAHQADVEVGDQEGRTPLHYAVSKNAVVSLRVLLETCPAAVNVGDLSGRTALHSACSEGRFVWFCEGEMVVLRCCPCPLHSGTHLSTPPPLGSLPVWRSSACSWMSMGLSWTVLTSA